MSGDPIVEQLAELRREIRELRAQRVGYVRAPVTAVDTGAATFSVTVPAQQDGADLPLDGVSSPPHFLPAVGDEVSLALSGARPIYQPGRIAAGAIGYPELSSDVTLDIGNGSGNTVTYSPDAPTGSGGRAGDIWWQLDGSVIVGAWQWDGTTWQAHTFGDQTVDTLTAAKITTGQIAAGTVVSVGDPAGEHSEIRDDAIAFVAPAADGSPVDVTEFGRQSGGVDSSTGAQTWAIDEKGSAAFQDLSVTGDPIFQGNPLSETLAGYASFYAGASVGGSTDPALTPSGGGETGLCEFTAELQAGHIYLLQSSNIWLRPGSGCSRIDLNLRYTVSANPGTNPPTVNLSSELYTRAPGVEFGSTNTVGHSCVFQKILRAQTYAHFRFLLSVFSVGGTAYIEMGSESHVDPTLGVQINPEEAQVWLIDLGVDTWANRAVLNTGGSSGGGTPPAAVKRYTYEYFPNWSRWFNGDGSVHADNSDAYQGRTPYYPANGDQASQIGSFTRTGGTSIFTDLQGATIEKVQVYLYANHWNFYDGGTAIIRYHNNALPGSLNNYAGDLRVSGWGRNQGRWIDITSWGSLFQSAGARGIQVGPAGSTDPTFYGIFDGPNGGNPPRLRATFTK